MKKSFAFIAIIFLSLVVVVSGCVGQSSTNNTSSNTTNIEKPIEQPVPAPPTQPSTEQPKTVTVDIKNFAFAPQTITIKKGDTIVWTNRDAAPHTVTSEGGNELNSPTLNKDQTYSHTFNTPGTFNYFCTIHPSMKGTVVVQ